MFIFDSELFDQLLQFKLFCWMRLDLPEPAVRQVEVGVAAIRHCPIEDPVMLVDVHWNNHRQIFYDTPDFHKTL
jgi:hypothetical protein